METRRDVANNTFHVVLANDNECYTRTTVIGVGLGEAAEEDGVIQY